MAIVDVPKHLTDHIRSTPEGLRGVPHRYTFAASLVVVCYLGRNPTGYSADGFYEFNPNKDGTLSPWHASRVLMVGETLFLLRSQPGFSEFCRRFKGRDFRSTLFELIAARAFLRGGFQLYAKPETTIKKEDFDFQAMRQNDTINVEVTAFTSPQFSENTVRNSLGEKRSQLPNNLPALIFCAYPESWLDISPDSLGPLLTSAAEKFFASTGRINAIVFMGEQRWNASKDLGVIMLAQRTVVNPKARREISSLDFLLNLGGTRHGLWCSEMIRPVNSRGKMANSIDLWMSS